MTRQLAFDLPPREAFRREDFFASPANAHALAVIGGWHDWPGHKMLLVGPAGAGKTHLAHMWAEDAGAAIVSAADLPGADLPGLAGAGAVAVENADAVAGVPEAEVALFHLHNLVVQRGSLLLTARTPARDWGLALPDLKSRVEAASVARLDPPDDALLSAVLVKLFADRQTVVQPALIPWLVARMERSIDAARALVAAMDARALAQGKPITKTTAQGLLDTDDAE
ncbi:MAG: chromosomal replication initiator DnaA [Pseudotabrizicola sp.]|uniref:chromosomal replication initiator DnaA n=1 Tax=Pseudotabrizicola sp. TaxID=2939647 RepID=UPI00272558F0|nr:chromosomal replication initiator DnaA [Pseudotabrizicola sp.]MDO8884226.1 chromosomal replication initiator DnaA [Pseudotabrizicola sp.]MDP2080557.1 chromosomal replication initiator DnaA [Pseudotabrizicola sp.]MDZ7573285.1 chromosomal replication initiator DnaA [Pseudotabrizicola sp.]